MVVHLDNKGYMMAKIFINNKFQKIKKLVYLHLGLLLSIILYFGFLNFCFFQAGYAAAINDSPYFNIIIYTAFALPLFFLILLVIYGVVLVKIGIRYIFYSLALWILSFLIYCLIGYSLSFFLNFPIAKGYYCYVRNNVDISELQTWLAEYEHTITTQDKYSSDRIFKDNWPACIKKLNPVDVRISGEEPQKYIRIQYGSFVIPSFGLCVMEKPVDIPLDSYYDSEYRIKLSDNAFIWQQIK